MSFVVGPQFSGNYSRPKFSAQDKSGQPPKVPQQPQAASTLQPPPKSRRFSIGPDRPTPP